MMSNRDGGQAFPTPPVKGVKCYEDDIDGEAGMSLRDWFAGQALTGLLGADVSLKTAANTAYAAADAMLAARKQE